MNLIFDPWIPVRRIGDGTDVDDIIRPAQIAEPDIVFPAWPRADMNVACLELLAGLLYMACPPEDADDWADRAPDADRLHEALQPYSKAFRLFGDAPLFLQDFEEIDGKLSLPDILFVDSVGDNAVKKGSDLMGRPGRYRALDPAMAAMALYTLQAFAPVGGAGHRASMRGGGPLVTLVNPPAAPEHRLWNLVWANVPDGRPTDPARLDVALPWLRKTVTSQKGATPVTPQGNSLPLETFFGMPRRVRLVAEPLDGKEMVTGVVQKPHGTNYEGWSHPLSPYYAPKAGADRLPRHFRGGHFGYANWIGTAIEQIPSEKPSAPQSYLADAVITYRDTRFADRLGQPKATILVSGWAMANATPVDFVYSEAPLLRLSRDQVRRVNGAAEAAREYTNALLGALQSWREVSSKSVAPNWRSEFYATTQAAFEDTIGRVAAGAEPADEIMRDWLSVMEGTALSIFQRDALATLLDLKPEDARTVTEAYGWLSAAFRGLGKNGKAAFAALDLPSKAKETA